ncbi:hypothetical protein GOP47_0017038 [Adiantum capillus-veneris]|uniref:Uncharacterized protein n=1 Tax=Adiantum capillus-veneris TaxID=13818 RepID=A0A9D4ZAV9_ADICA|nr:hypothetical protein GOP47_0017038 [Adiantum capillus-veneris]
MSGRFAIQINPELIFKVTEPEMYVRQKRVDLFRRTRRAEPVPEPHEPLEPLAPVEPPQPLHQTPSDGFLAAANKPWHGHCHDDDNAALAPYRKVAAGCVHAVESLRNQEEVEREEVQRRAKELQSKQYHPPEPKPFPCPDEQRACIKCLTENRDDPLKCQDAIKSYSLCAQQVRQRFVTAGFGSPQGNS